MSIISRQIKRKWLIGLVLIIQVSCNSAEPIDISKLQNYFETKDIDVNIHENVVEIFVHNSKLIAQKKVDFLPNASVGHPVACGIAIQTIDIILKEKLAEQAKQMEKLLTKKLNKLKEK